MAQFRKRGGTWTYIVDIGIEPVTKKRKQVSKGGFKSKREAQSACREVELEIERGTFIKESSISLEDCAKEWLETYKKSAKVSSQRAREKELKHFISVWGLCPIKDITKRMYVKRIYELFDKYSHNYASGIHACGRMLFQYALEFGIIKQNPTEKVRLPKRQQTIEELEEDDEEKDFFEKDELAAFLKLAEKEGLEMDILVFYVLAYTGLRIGELLALKWSDFNETQKTLRVTKTLYNPNNNIQEYTLLTPKTRLSTRTIDIDDMVVNMLKKHKVKQKEVKLRVGRNYHDEGFIFARENGYPQLRKVIETRLKRLLKKMGTEKNITPHSFRHTHASLQFEAEASIKEVMKRLGHNDIETTMKIYAHVTKGMQEKTSQKFSILMEGLLKD
jgi:integrase